MSALVDCLLRGDQDSDEYCRLVRDRDPGQLPPLYALESHPDPAVRQAMVSNLPHFDEDPPADASVELAIRLTRDAAIGVRDWACFVLGTQWRDIDTPALRDALHDRLDDLGRDVRCEALAGLAYRLDERARPRVRAALARPSGDVWALELVAAGALGDPEFYPFVLRHLDGWDAEDNQLTVEAVRRLTDPAGPGADLFRGVAELYGRRADGQGDSAASLAQWSLMLRMLDIAPHRTRAFFTATAACLSDDPAALIELQTNSALASMLDLV